MSLEDFKAKKKKYGKTMAPIPCTRAYRRGMAFDHTDVHTESYILINDNTSDKYPTGSRTHVNLYNGECGAGYDAEKATHPLGDEKAQKKKLKGYQECLISECPVAVSTPLVKPVPVPVTPAAEETEELETSEEEQDEEQESDAQESDAPESQ